MFFNFFLSYLVGKYKPVLKLPKISTFTKQQKNDKFDDKKKYLCIFYLFDYPSVNKCSQKLSP